MSIPLVQNNEKDSINTSIIAIKRNIERINMLLGLSNSEEIDTSKFATKDELQQAVTDLQPVNEVTVDNMHSVTSNAVAEANSYVVGQEVKTGGMFFDGANWKDVYRKVIDCGALPNNTDKYIFHGISNLDFVIKMSGMAKDGAINVPLPYTNAIIFRTGAQICIRSSTDVSFYTSSYVILEYTKTTD